MTAKELSDAGKKSAIARGYIPLVNGHTTKTRRYIPEIEFAYRLSQKKEFRIGTRINHLALTQELNNVYHNGRTPEAVKVALQRYAYSQMNKYLNK